MEHEKFYIDENDTYLSMKALKCNMMHHVDLEKSINKVVNNHFLPHFKTLKKRSRFTVSGVGKKAAKTSRKNSSTTNASTMAGAFGLASRCEFSQCQGA